MSTLPGRRGLHLRGTRPDSRLNFTILKEIRTRKDIERNFLYARHPSDIEIEEDFGEDGLDDSARHEATWTGAGAVSEG